MSCINASNTATLIGLVAGNLVWSVTVWLTSPQGTQLLVRCPLEKHPQDKTHWQRMSCGNRGRRGRMIREATEQPESGGRLKVRPVLMECSGPSVSSVREPADLHILPGTISLSPSSQHHSPHMTLSDFRRKARGDAIIYYLPKKKKNIPAALLTRSGRHAHNFRGSRAVGVTDTESFRPADPYGR